MTVKQFKTILRITIILLICNKTLNAKNYYVSNSGNDKNTGTTPWTSWKTISKVNSKTFLPGDSILFRCGDIWRKNILVTSSSGKKGNHIIYSSYGKGNKPKLYGSEIIKSYSPHPAIKHLYSCNEKTTVNPINYSNRNYKGSIFYMIKDSIIWGDGIKLYKNDINSLKRNFQWTWNEETIYFYYDGDINNIKSIECIQSARGIDIRKEYITIDGLELKYWGSRCIGTSIYPERTMRGLQIRNCHLAYTASKNEGVGFGIAVFHSDMIIENNIIHGNGRRNISLNITNTNKKCIMRDVIIQDNELYDGYHTTGVDMGLRGSNHMIRNITIRRNKIWEYYGVYKEATSNMIFLFNNGNLANFDSIYIYNNTIQNINGSGIWVTGLRNVYIINNTFTGPSTPFYTRGAFINSTGTNNGNHIIMNNIFMNFGNKPMTVIDGARDGSTTLTFCDYNLFYAVHPSTYIFYEVGKINHRNYAWKEIQKEGYELNGLPPQFPHFVDSLNDLRLKSTSPALGKAIPIPYIKTDLDGNPRHQEKPDIGAYEKSYKN